MLSLSVLFFFNDTATTEIYTLSLPRRSSDLALDVDDSLTTKRGALWGSFLVALYDGQSDYRQALATFEELPEATPVHVVRVAQARILVAARIGNISEAAVSALPALALLDDVFDPLVR